MLACHNSKNKVPLYGLTSIYYKVVGQYVVA